MNAIVKSINSVWVKVEPQDENSQNCQPLNALPSMLESDGMANVITGTGNETEKPKLCANNQTGGFADFLADIYITLLKMHQLLMRKQAKK